MGAPPDVGIGADQNGSIFVDLPQLGPGSGNIRIVARSANRDDIQTDAETFGGGTGRILPGAALGSGEQRKSAAPAKIVGGYFVSTAFEPGVG